MPSSPSRRAPSSVSMVPAGIPLSASADASTTRPPSKRSRTPRHSRPVYTAGNSENVITPSAESSTGDVKNSPPGRFRPAASTVNDRPAIDSVRSVSAPTMRTSSEASKSSAYLLMRSRSASQSCSTASKSRSAKASVDIPASCASAGVGNWPPTHFRSPLNMRSMCGRMPVCIAFSRSPESAERLRVFSGASTTMSASACSSSATSSGAGLSSRSIGASRAHALAATRFPPKPARRSP